jgi:hypothetical protein
MTATRGQEDRPMWTGRRSLRRALLSICGQRCPPPRIEEAVQVTRVVRCEG